MRSTWAKILQRAVILAMLLIVWSATTAGAQLAEAAATATQVRLLYESADYDSALAVAARLHESTLSPEDSRQLNLYQALCELALGNQARAEEHMEMILRAEPLYRPPAGMPNRIHALTDRVRGQLMPTLAQTHYRTGKAHFDAKDCASAAGEFAIVLALVPEQDESTSPQLADVRTLASGFLSLCKSAAAPAPAPAAVPPAAPAPVASSEPARAAESAIVPPVAIRRELPPWPVQLNTARPAGNMVVGTVEVVVNKSGRVERARFIKRIHPLYDGLLLTAMKNWVFEPATKNGEPVEFVLHLNVDIR